MELLEDNAVRFSSSELKEIYEPIVNKFGFTYDEYFDDKGKRRGLVWTKLFEDSTVSADLWPLMVIEEANYDYYPSLEEATYFTTRLYWEDYTSPSGLLLGVNPNEFEDGSGDELEVFYTLARDAQAAVNKVLEDSRKLLANALIQKREALRVTMEERK